MTRASIITLFLMALVAPSFAQAPSGSTPRTRTLVDAVVQQPRSYGYFVGDLVTQRVLLQSAGRSFSPATLPPIERVSVWFERRRAVVETDSALRRWLVVDYQVLNAPQKLTAVTLPAWLLVVGASSGVAAANGANEAVAASPAPAAATIGVTLRVPATLINIAPLSPPGSPAQVGSEDLRPDRPPPRVATESLWRAVFLSCGALAFTLVAWLAWVMWRNWRATDAQPFALALREMRRLDDREPLAWQALHRAFDRTAGRVVQSSTLPALFEQAPQLNPLRDPIEKFFLQSSRLFFAGNTVTGTATAIATATETAEPLSPRELCAGLRRIERRHER